MRSEAWHEINDAEAPINDPDCTTCNHLEEKFYECDGTWGHYCKIHKTPVEPWRYCANHSSTSKENLEESA